jgi:predicted ribosome quality control (RQC) complex YloA/Tae2 family protein
MAQGCGAFSRERNDDLQFFVSWPIQSALNKEFIMTTINTSSLSTYSSAFSVGFKNDESTKSDATTASVNLRGNVYEEPKAAGASKSEGGGTPREQAIKQLQEQIKQTQKMLEQQQQQLAAAQSSKAPEQEKAAQVMAIQQQISGTMAQLGAQQASLMELMKGSVNTTA